MYGSKDSIKETNYGSNYLPKLVQKVIRIRQTIMITQVHPHALKGCLTAVSFPLGSFYSLAGLFVPITPAFASFLLLLAV